MWVSSDTNELITLLLSCLAGAVLVAAGGEHLFAAEL